MSPIRILVVDGFAQWRDFVVSMLQKVPTVRVICEVSDGVEAVQKAEELQPDLILLDIGLPGINGIAAARQILSRSSISKILFLSQISDPDVVRVALGLGASFVVKADACEELLAAVKTVTRGKVYLSSRLAGLRLQPSSKRTSTIGLQFESESFE
jgi:DNA-binding NarL/FixJ family response regulator